MNRAALSTFFAKALIFLTICERSAQAQNEASPQPQQLTSEQPQTAAQAKAGPKTQLEQFQAKTGSVILKANTQVGTVTDKFAINSIKVFAMEFTNAATGDKSMGVVIEVSKSSSFAQQNNSYVDLEEIDSLLKGIDYIARVDKRSTKFEYLEAIYRTKGDLTISRFTSKTGMMITVQSGGVTAYFDSKELPKIRDLIQKAQATLREIGQD
jgi:hypothetical protein